MVLFLQGIYQVPISFKYTISLWNAFHSHFVFMYLLFAFCSRGLLLLMLLLLLLLLVLLESQALNLVAQWSGLHGKHVLKMTTSP